jgi:glycosyltransferase involved in cell wall biosynthesis
MNRNCLIYNYAQHYREGIFKLLDSELKCESYFGDKMGDVQKMDYELLNHFQKEVKNVKLKYPFYWQNNVVNLIFKPYNNYIILGEYYCISTWVILLMGKITNKKFYLWTHGWYGNEGMFKRVLKKIFFKLADGIFLYGNYAKKIMIEDGFNNSKLHVIFNSLDYEKQFKVRNQTVTSDIYKSYFKNDNPVIIFIGRLTKVKKLHLIIENQEELRKKGIFVNNVFIGSGEELTNLKELVSSFDSNKTNWFYGPSYNEREIGELVYNADLCLSPGNVGLTAMHSMVYGTPVITHNDFTNQMPEFEAIKKGVTGDFFKKDDLFSIRNVVVDWIVNHKDRNLTRNHCFERIDNYFNPNYQLKIISNVLNEN